MAYTLQLKYRIKSLRKIAFFISTDNTILAPGISFSGRFFGACLIASLKNHKVGTENNFPHLNGNDLLPFHFLFFTYWNTQCNKVTLRITLSVIQSKP